MGSLDFSSLKNLFTTMTMQKGSDTAKFGRFHRGMLEEDVYFPPSLFEAGLTSLAHTPGDILNTIAAAEKVFRPI